MARRTERDYRRLIARRPPHFGIRVFDLGLALSSSSIGKEAGEIMVRRFAWFMMFSREVILLMIGSRDVLIAYGRSSYY